MYRKQEHVSAILCCYFGALFADAGIPEVTLNRVLSFITGAEEVPAGGFECPASLYFCPISQFPTASTCALQSTLPTTHYNNAVLFKEKILYAFHNHGGFGLIWHRNSKEQSLEKSGLFCFVC